MFNRSNGNFVIHFKNFAISFYFKIKESNCGINLFKITKKLLISQLIGSTQLPSVFKSRNLSI